MSLAEGFQLIFLAVQLKLQQCRDNTSSCCLRPPPSPGPPFRIAPPETESSWCTPESEDPASPRLPSLPAFEHIKLTPSFPDLNLDGLCCCAPTPPSTPPPPPIDPEEEARIKAANLKERQEKLALLTASQRRKLERFTLPELEMVTGRRPGKRWQAVAQKVVTANRLRIGLGREITIEGLRIEELGGRGGELVFGPVAVFNGQVCMRVKKPIKDVRIAVRFQGCVGEGKREGEFLGVEKIVFRGDLEPGLRSFLFGFNFPYVNLPPTSENPRIAYGFTARVEVLGKEEDARDYYTRNHPDVAEYASKPLRITFIPYVDPSLETPLISRKVSTRRTRSKPGNLTSSSSVTPTSSGAPSAHTLVLSDTATENTAVRKFPKPKLTLTTADMDVPSGSSTVSSPVIDRPHPSALSSAITRTTRITDEANNTLARLLVELPRSRFLPGEEIAVKLTLQVANGVRMPKGFGARVLETRYLAREPETGATTPATEASDDDDWEGVDEATERFRMKRVGKERIYQLTGKKFLLRTDEAGPIKEEGKNPATTKGDGGLEGGTEIVTGITIRLPSFKAFIQDSLLPTLSLPLGNPKEDDADATPQPTPGPSRAPTFPASPMERVAASESASATSPTTSSSTAPTSTASLDPRELYFKTLHTLQLTILMNGASSWYQYKVEEKLEVTVPIILGNKHPPSRRTPELRLNDSEVWDGSSWSGSWSESMGGSNHRGSRSASGSGTGTGSGTGSKNGSGTITVPSIPSITNGKTRSGSIGSIDSAKGKGKERADSLGSITTKSRQNSLSSIHESLPRTRSVSATGSCNTGSGSGRSSAGSDSGTATPTARSPPTRSLSLPSQKSLSPPVSRRGSDARSTLPGSGRRGSLSVPGEEETKEARDTHEEWREGMRFLTLRESKARPGFMGDHF